jgi:hypothetical protein
MVEKVRYLEQFAGKNNKRLFQWSLPLSQYLAYGADNTYWMAQEADHSHPPSTEIMNACSLTSTPQCVFRVWCQTTEITLLQ